MSRVENNILIIEETPEEKCKLCGDVAELRPYGANGENICFKCGMKDEETTKKMFISTMLVDSVKGIMLK